MSDVEYSIAAILQLKGGDDVEAKLGKVSGKASQAGKQLHAVGASAANGFATMGRHVDAAVSKLGHFAAAAATAGAALLVGGGLHQIKSGLVDVNAKLEESEIGFGVLFQKLGGQSFAGGLRTAKVLMAGIRDDAASLPGEFQDFVGMAQTLTAPMLNLGKSAEDIRNFTKDSVVSAAALGIHFDQAAREAAMLMEGHAGGHNIFGTRLGITANTTVGGKKWNEADAEARFKHLSKLVKTNDEVLKAYQGSWMGLTTTLTDGWKRWKGIATQPLFERLKQSMAGLSTNADKHKAQLDHLAHVVGDKLAGAYDWVLSKAKLIPGWWEAAKGPMREFTDGLVDGFKRAWPYIEKIGHFLKHELQHPLAALKHLALLKGGAMLAQAAPSMLSMGANVASMFGGGAGAAGGAAAGGAGMAGAAAVAAPIAVAAAAVTTAIVDDTLGSQKRLASSLHGVWDGLTNAVGPLIQKGGLLRDALGLVGAAIILNFSVPLKALEWSLDAFGFVMKGANAIWDLAKSGVSLMSDALVALCKDMKWATEAMVWASGKWEWLKGLFKSGPDSGDPTKNIGADKPLRARDDNFVSIGPSDDQMKNPDVDAFGRKGKPLKPVHNGDEPGKVHPGNNIDMRGARIELKLDVRDQDPDRIVRRVFDAVGRYVARPVTAGGAPGVG